MLGAVLGRGLGAGVEMGLGTGLGLDELVGALEGDGVDDSLPPWGVGERVGVALGVLVGTA